MFLQRIQKALLVHPEECARMFPAKLIGVIFYEGWRKILAHLHCDQQTCQVKLHFIIDWMGGVLTVFTRATYELYRSV